MTFKSNQFVCIFYSLFLTSFFNQVNVIQCVNINAPGPLTIYKGEGLLTYLLHTNDFGNLKSCNLTTGEDSNVENYILDPTTVEPYIYRTARNEYVQRFSKDKCGVRMLNVSEVTPKQWTLLSEDDDGLQETGNFEVNVDLMSYRDNPTYKNVTTTYGSTVDLTCIAYTNTDRFCRIISQTTGEQYTCNANSRHVHTENTDWTCHLLTWGRIEELTVHTSVIVEPQLPTNVHTITESDKAIILTCYFNASITQCRAISPNAHKEYYLREGFLNNEYSTYDTRLQIGVCSIEIEKPLKDEHFGFWKIISDNTGCILHVGTDDSFNVDSLVESNDENDPIQIEILADGDPLNIMCEAPYQIEFCFLVLPDLRVQFMTSSDFAKSRYLGKCQFNGVIKMTGPYICGFNRYNLISNNANDSQIIDDYRQSYVNIHYYVHVYDQVLGEVENGKIETDVDEEISLLCKSAFKTRMSSCVFISPSKNIYILNDRIPTNGRVQYYGTGLINGQCGIVIKKVISEDFGKWRCNFATSATHRLDIDVVQTVWSKLVIIISVMGTILFIAIIAIIIFSIYYYKYKRNRHSELLELSELTDENNNSNKTL